jgi:hypothetical protein
MFKTCEVFEEFIDFLSLLVFSFGLDASGRFDSISGVIVERAMREERGETRKNQILTNFNFSSTILNLKF